MELLPVTVAGIPSMHICLDFIHELVNQSQLEKQVCLLMAYVRDWAISESKNSKTANETSHPGTSVHGGPFLVTHWVNI